MERDITSLANVGKATDEDAMLIEKVMADVHANKYSIDITPAAMGEMI